MRVVLTLAVLCLSAGLVLAQFLVLFYNHWFFANFVLPKTFALAIPLSILLGATQFSSQRVLATRVCLYWLAVYAVALWNARSFDLQGLSFTEVLNYEAAVVWVPVVWILMAFWIQGRPARRAKAVLRQLTARQLQLRRRIREGMGESFGSSPQIEPRVGVLLAICIAAALGVPGLVFAQEGTEPEPARQFVDRHLEMRDQQRRIVPPTRDLPGIYPTPLHLRERQVFWIRIDNRKEGGITVIDVDGREHFVGKVLAPVANVNPNGFTASGWGAPGRVTATSVNAIHVKVDHDYSTGKGVIFSLTPVEFATFDPKEYKSYFNSSSSLFTDIPAGREIFGGRWAPLVGSRLYIPASRHRAAAIANRSAPAGLGWATDVQIGLRDTTAGPQPAPDSAGQLLPVAPDFRPAEADIFYIRVERLKYNPEWIDFENRFGGLIWVKELGLEPYPIGQVLKPVAGCGRFLGTQYAGVGRIRANHPGVIDISTSPEGVTGGFQIIPRDHSMSPEMTNARVKTQWMVIGPLYALDPSWEGLPPLFTDYLYPAWTPSDSELASPSEAYLSRFTVRARYSDDSDANKYVLLHEKRGLDNLAFKTLTHLRIFFPRDSKL